MLTPEEVEERRRQNEERRRLKREHRRKRLIFYSLAVVLALVLAAVSAWYTFQKGMESVSDGSPGDGLATERALADGRINILLLGADEKEHDAGRTDTIMVVSVDLRSGEVGVLSIPRDTRVRIPGRRGYDRINAAHAYGGPRLAMKTVEEFLDMSLDYYVKLNFQGFERLVDALGGIEIDVKKRMKYDDSAQELHIDLYSGRQVLNGEQALGYVRYRSDGLGDIALVDPAKGVYDGRVERQQQFVKGFAEQFLQPRTVVKIPEIVSELGTMVTTDMPADIVLRLAYSLKSLDVNQIETALVPGIGQKVNGVSYWVPDQKRTEMLVDRLVRGQSKGEGIRVEILNGNGLNGSAQKAASLFRASGLEIVAVGNADRFDYERTQVLGMDGLEQARIVAGLIEKGNIGDNPSGSDNDRLVGHRTASASTAGPEVLETAGRLPGSPTSEDGDDPTERVDVIVILGKDFRI